MELALIAAATYHSDAASWAQVIILAITAGVVVWYACETRRLVTQVVHQNEISLRPLVLPEFARAGTRGVFKLKNCGVGCALNVRVSPIPIVVPASGQAERATVELRFSPSYYMAAGEDLEVPLRVWDAGKPTEPSTFDTFFFPHYPGDELRFEILFEDVEGGSYAIPVTIRAGHEREHLPRDVEIGAVRKRQ